MKKKITEKQIKKIRELKKQDKSCPDIAEILNLNIHLVKYWANDEQRKKHIQGVINCFKKKTKEERRKYYQSRKEYNRIYMKKRYNEDKEFREKQKARTRRKK